MDDITIGEGEEISPNTEFVKTWRIRNSGWTDWPEGTVLVCTRVSGIGVSPTIL
jgi:hypothetical protein